MMGLPLKRLFFPFFAIGIVVLMVAINSRDKSPVQPAQSTARAVDVLTLNQQYIAPVVTGFGRVTPQQTWQAIAEVSGKVVYRHPGLEKGNILPAGTELLRIDPSDYQLALAQAQADVSVKEANLVKLDLNHDNLKSTLEIEKRRLALNTDELTRKKNLSKKGLTSQSDLDDEQQAFLSQQARVQDLENQLKVLPNERRITQAQLDASKLARTLAQRNVLKTQVVLPIDSKIAEVNIEQDQFVQSQQSMVVAHGLNSVEVDAQISIHDMQILFDSLSSRSTAGLNQSLAQLRANVMLSSGSFNQAWSAHVARLSDTVNLNQATVGVILNIPLSIPTSNQAQLKLDALPSLVNGMFVKATIEGVATPHWLIPEQALRGDRIYLLENGALSIKPVDILFRHDKGVIVRGDLIAGQQLVINDLLPAVEGMALRALTVDGKAVASKETQRTNAAEDVK